MASAERDRLSDGAADAADLVALLNESVLAHIGDHEIVLSYQDLQHNPKPFIRWQAGRVGRYLRTFRVIYDPVNEKVRNVRTCE